MTQPITARRIVAREVFRDSGIAGSFWIGEPDSDGEVAFWYCCPCGCRQIAPLTVGRGFKPAEGPSWEWNGSKDRPTLSPSVNHTGHWHGWLRDGVWTSV